jgi:hypothetical protein
MKLAIMQPYFLPYIGYFQLIDMVDIFVIYDDIEYSKKGCINRNRMLQNGEPVYFTLPLKKDSDYLDIVQRFLAGNFEKEKDKFLRKIEYNYIKAPCFVEFFPLIEEILHFERSNLFEFIFNSIKLIMGNLRIKTSIIVSSTLGKEIKKMKAQDKVLAICKSLNATQYINSIGGISLYNKEDFKKENIDLLFYRCNDIAYKQFNNEFVPWLSIIDVLMFNAVENVKGMLNKYELI